MGMLKSRLINSVESLQDFLQPLFAATVFFHASLASLSLNVFSCFGAGFTWCSLLFPGETSVQWELCDLVITLNIPEHQLTVNLWKQQNKNKILVKGHLGA